MLKLKTYHKLFKIVALFVACFFLLDFAIDKLLVSGLNKYYGLGNDSSIAIVGHSHVMLGLDKEEIEKGLNQKVSKYTREGVNIANRHLMIKQLVKQNPNIETVIYGVDAWMFTGMGLSENSYTTFFPFMGDKNVRKFIKESANFSEYWTKAIIKSTRYNEGLVSSSVRGHLSNWNNLKNGNIDVGRLRKNVKNGNFRKIDNNPENIKTFKKSIDYLLSNDIKVILVYVPTIDLYNNAEPKKFDETLNIIESFIGDDVYFFNYLEPWESHYDLFFDKIHLNKKGQHIISKELVKDLKLLE